MKFLVLLLLVTACATKAPIEITPEEARDVIVLDHDRTDENVSTSTPAPVGKLPGKVFSARSSLSWVHQVAKVANCVVNKEEFYKEIAAFPGYDKRFTSKTPAQVAEDLRGLRPFVISTYKTRNPWSDAIATTYNTDPTTVYFNLRQNPRPMPDMVHTAVHEATHLLGFGHGDNYPAGKENAVPNRAGAIAEKFAQDCK